MKKKLFVLFGGIIFLAGCAPIEFIKDTFFKKPQAQEISLKGSSKEKKLYSLLVTKKDFDGFIMRAKRAGKPAVIKFFATWCGICAQMEPIYKTMMSDLQAKVLFAKVDIDVAKKVAVTNNIKGIPTFVYYRDGKEVERLIGIATLDALKKSVM